MFASFTSHNCNIFLNKENGTRKWKREIISFLYFSLMFIYPCNKSLKLT